MRYEVSTATGHVYAQCATKVEALQKLYQVLEQDGATGAILYDRRARRGSLHRWHYAVRMCHTDRPLEMQTSIIVCVSSERKAYAPLTRPSNHPPTGAPAPAEEPPHDVP
jgi:hypothetical protein